MASTVWRGHLTFGLISIPVRLFRAARAERIALRRVAASGPSSRGSSAGLDDNKTDLPSRQSRTTTDVAEQGRSWDASPNSSLLPVRQASVASVSPSNVANSSLLPDSEVTRGFEVENNRFIEIPKEDLKSLKVETSSELSIQQFVSLVQIDPLYFETSYYVVPEDVGERAYALLYQALLNTHVVALAELAMHGRDHIVIVRPGLTGLVAHTMFYSNEVHSDEQYRADISAVNTKELALAETLIHSLTGNFKAEVYKNQYQERLSQLVNARVDEDASSRPIWAQRLSTPAVVDIADALRASLAQLKKPAQVTAEPKPKTAARKRPARTGAA